MCRSSASKQCWTQLLWLTRPSSVEMGCGVSTLTTARAHVGTQLVVSLPRRSMAENEIRTTGTCATSSAIEMLVTGSKIASRSETVLDVNNTMKGTMTTMVPSMIDLTDIIIQKEDATKAGSKLFPMT
jgi:hypothetical protein